MNTVTPSEIAAVQTVADQTLSDEAAQQAQAVLDKAQTTAAEVAADEDATAPEPPPENETPARPVSVSDTIEPDAEDAPAVLRFIPLSRLRISRRNVRKTRTDSPEQLAESIARVGLLQNLIVIVDGEDYGVVGGRRRLQALRLLVKQKRLSVDQIIPCLEVPDDSAVTVSLTENVQREAMHPADQFEAFKALVNEGRPIEDIAADFGVTPLVVQRRLKLARVSPRLLADYRADQVTLEQLMALAITDDHTAQETAYYEAPQWERDAIALRRRLTDTEVDASRSALARFVGIENYTAAGGGLRRDLFAEEDSGVYLTDAGLLHRLATAKLEAVTVQIKTEGWKWVAAMPTLGYSELSAFRRAAQGEREPTARERKRIAKLEAEQARIEEALFAAEEAEDEDAAAPLYEQGDQVGQALDALYASLLAYAPETMAQAGAIVTPERSWNVMPKERHLSPSLQLRSR
jgi:ParB family chromosome partitioning protein